MQSGSVPARGRAPPFTQGHPRAWRLAPCLWRFDLIGRYFPLWCDWLFPSRHTCCWWGIEGRVVMTGVVVGMYFYLFNYSFFTVSFCMVLLSSFSSVMPMLLIIALIVFLTVDVVVTIIISFFVCVAPDIIYFFCNAVQWKTWFIRKQKPRAKHFIRCI